MKNVKLLFMMSLLFLAEIGFSQNYVTYSPISKTIDVNSGVEGTVDVLVNCYGSTSESVFLNAMQSCANNDGILSTSYTNGSILTPGQSTTIRYKFKKTVTANTQIAYKFSTDGSCFQDESKMIKITVNYKAAPATAITNNTISGNQNIYEGQSASIISGSTPSGGNGTFTYSWQKKVGSGSWTIISGATSTSYSPGIPVATTSYRRNVSSATFSSVSNEVTVTVIPVPIIQNNIITINGTSVDGSSPTGGTGSYTYTWGILDEDGDFSELTAVSSQNVIFSNPAFKNYINSPKTFQLTRIVYSGTIRSFSNYVVMPHNSDIQNNTLSINNNQVIGSIPTGGIGGYTYTWGILDEDGDFSELTAISSQNVMFSDPAFTNYINSPKTFKLTRIVYSGTTRSFSNYVVMPHNSGLSLNSMTVSTVYPNPTSDSVNFTTSSSSNQEMEIIVYSEGLRNAQSVFKGTSTPNQIIKWNIPSNYSKGIYYYKVISGNKEVKSGKILYQ
ncbi:T9SS type A sorting domain-containing protein [Flavobacterium sp.]|uniref:T9SS type A sorting domain-containing protein n=1 Tax=Flavobacterium sp. TaxID=239 RepID=UPI00374DD360